MHHSLSYHVRSVLIAYLSCVPLPFRLKSAGAVLVAKLVTGSLAYDDIWFGGRTRNPWNIEEFSTGSSAGPAASTSAG
jgi:Asp-tRNA(Asn)/Glu-tRNA(Gln) amidotransferase A subunit family amidase